MTYKFHNIDQLIGCLNHSVNIVSEKMESERRDEDDPVHLMQCLCFSSCPAKATFHKGFLKKWFLERNQCEEKLIGATLLLFQINEMI